MEITPFKIDSEDLADTYLHDLLKQPENRSVDEIHARAQMLVSDDLKAYFVAKGAEMLGTE